MASQSGPPNITLSGGQLALVIVGSICMFMNCVVLFLRLLALHLRKRLLGRDDVTMFIAFVCAQGFGVSSFVGMRWGIGLSVADPPLDWIENVLKAAYVAQILYVLSIFFVKSSILFLYLRIATRVHNFFYKSTIATLVLLCLNIIPSVIIAVFQCIPPDKYWTPTMKGGYCLNDIIASYYFNSAFTIATDCVMLAIPLPTLWKLQRPRGAQRMALLATFLVGAISTAASCVRLSTVRYYQSNGNPLRDSAPIDMWSFIEIGLGIFCASVPAIKSLFIRKPERTTTMNYQVSSYYDKPLPDSSGSSTQSPHTGTPIPMTGIGKADSLLPSNCDGESTEQLLRRPPKAALYHSPTAENRPRSSVPNRRRDAPDPESYHAAVVASTGDSASLRSFGSRNIKITRSIQVGGLDREQGLRVPSLPFFHFGRSLERLGQDWARDSAV